MHCHGLIRPVACSYRANKPKERITVASSLPFQITSCHCYEQLLAFTGNHMQTPSTMQSVMIPNEGIYDIRKGYPSDMYRKGKEIRTDIKMTLFMSFKKERHSYITCIRVQGRYQKRTIRTTSGRDYRSLHPHQLPYQKNV